MKKIISALLAVLMCAAAFASCSGGDSSSAPDKPTEAAEGSKYDEPDKNTHQFYVRDDFDAEVLTATLFNTKTDDKTTIKLEKYDKDAKSDYTTYTGWGDTEKYNRLVINSDDEPSIELAFNDYVSGWHVSSFGVLPFTVGDNSEEIDYARKTFKYEDGEKDVYIWTPEDYDAKSKEKYSVIYMPDGQNMFERSSTTYGSWGVAESVTAMMSQSDNRAIIVGIDDSTSNRDSELTPDIGELQWSGESYKNGTGEYYANFVMKKVVPYVEKNYNVYTDREHTAVCGSSSGGIESFYIGMQNADKFGYIGALSPAFGLFSDDVWKAYLSEKKFGENTPFVYIYCGNADDLEKSLYPFAKSMQDNLASVSYPADKVVFEEYDEGLHNERYWRAIFPEFLKYMFE